MSLNIPCEFMPHLDEARRYYDEVIAPSISLPDLIPSLLRAPLLVRASGLIDVLRWYQERKIDVVARPEPLDDGRALAFFAAEQQRIYDGMLDELQTGQQRVQEMERSACYSDLLEVELRRVSVDAAEAAERSSRLEHELSAAIAEAQARSSRLEHELSAAIAEAQARSSRLEHELSAAIAEAQARSSRLEHELSAAKAEAEARSFRLGHELFAAIVRIGKAEADLGRAHSAVATVERWQASETIYRQRGLLGRLLFRRDGRPVRGLRRILFHNNGKPRGIFRSWVVSNGVPRKPFQQWMTSEKYLACPKAYRCPSERTPISDVASTPVLPGEAAVAPAAPSELTPISDLASAPVLPREAAVAPAAPLDRTIAGSLVAEDSRCVLIIDSVYPTPDRDSGSVDAINFVQIFLQLGFSVYFVATANFNSSGLNAVEKRAKDKLESLGAVVLDDIHAHDIVELIRSTGWLFELFFLSRVHAGGQFFETIRAYSQDAKILFNTVDLHFVRELREGHLEGDRAKINAAFRTQARELYLIRLADSTIVVSEEEVKLLEKEVPGAPVYEVPLIRDVPGRRADFRERSHIGFIGGYRHHPNLDAVRYFLDVIWPLVLRELPEAQFHLMGADMPDELRQRTDPGLVIVGYVADLREAFEDLRLTVAPLRYGAGAKGKVVSSLSHGVPCICSSIAAEGMQLDAAGGVLVADDPEEFAKLVVQAYKDEALWQRLSDGGLRLMRERHDFKAGIDRMTAIVQALSLNDTKARQM